MASAYAPGGKEACPDVLLEAGCMARDVLTVAEGATQPESGCRELHPAGTLCGSPGKAEPDTSSANSSFKSFTFNESSCMGSSFGGSSTSRPRINSNRQVTRSASKDRGSVLTESARTTRSAIAESAISNVYLASSGNSSRNNSSRQTSMRGAAADGKWGTACSSSRSTVCQGNSEIQIGDRADGASKQTPLQAAMQAHRPSTLAVHIVDLGPMKKLPLVTVSTHILLWRFLPCGSYLLRFEKAPDTTVVRVTSTCDLVCFCCVDNTVHARTSAPRLCKQHFWDWFRLVRDAVLCLVLGFFIHLVPAVAIGVEVVLGSEDNVSLFSLAWLGCWLGSFLLVQLLRPWGIAVGGRACACAPCGGAKFIPFSSYAHAKATCEYWVHAYMKQRSKGFEPAERVLLCTWRLGAGLVVLTALLANAVYFATLVRDCVERGCCSGDDATLDACRGTGFPQ